MKFLVDAQLPRKLARMLREAGHDAVHTLELPRRNRTSDAEINAIAHSHGRIVVTKDTDFIDSFVLKRQPEKLLLVSTGNITNDALEALLRPQIGVIATAFESHDFIELTRTVLVLHD